MPFATSPNRLRQRALVTMLVPLGPVVAGVQAGLSVECGVVLMASACPPWPTSELWQVFATRPGTTAT